MKKIFLNMLIIFLIFINQEIFSQLDYGFDFTKAGSSGLQFLKIGIGAREVAMGEAVNSIVNDANSVFWNVGGLAYVENKQASFSYTSWLVESQVNSAVIAFPVGSFVFGISAISFSINEFEETTALQPDGTGRMVDAGDLLIGAAVSRRFTDKLSIGLQVKYVREELDDYSIDNVLFDVGALYFTGFRQLRLAFSLQHFGPDMKLENLSFRTPLLFRVSAGDELFNFKNVKLLVAADLIHPTDNDEWINVGGELVLLDNFAIRSGYRFNTDINNFSFGFGVISPRLMNMNLKLDYAYSPEETVFDAIHRLTVSLEF